MSNFSPASAATSYFENRYNILVVARDYLSDKYYNEKVIRDTAIKNKSADDTVPPHPELPSVEQILEVADRLHSWLMRPSTAVKD